MEEREGLGPAGTVSTGECQHRRVAGVRANEAAPLARESG